MIDWKDDILNSTKGMDKPQPPEDAFDRVLQRIRNQDNSANTSRDWIAVAATVSLVVLINVFIIAYHSTHRDSTSHENTDAYASLVSNYNLYENAEQ